MKRSSFRVGLPLTFISDAPLCFNVLADYVEGRSAGGAHEVTVRPEGGQATFQARELFTQQSCGASFDAFHNQVNSELWIHVQHGMNMVGHYFECFDDHVMLGANLSGNSFEPLSYLILKHGTPVFWAPHNMIVAVKYDVPVRAVRFLEHTHCP
jgi:hypothetical protein